MKTIRLITFSLLMCTGAMASPALQDSLGLPGDNLDLYGVLELFKKSESPEEFEKALNKEDNKLNNLDLNGDNQIDYIHVIDRAEKDVHALVLQVSVTETETQDVAVIELEKKEDGNVDVQIIGDEKLYGKNYIVEPGEENASKTAEAAPEKTGKTVVVNVYHWPSVQYIYRPSYVVWVSPWGWSHYPGWWRPWRPMHWHHYHPHWTHYHGYHRRADVHRVVVAHNVYHGHRKAAAAPARRTAAPAQRMGRPERKEQRINNQTQKPRVQQSAPRQRVQKSGPKPRVQPSAPKQRQNKQGGQNGRRK
ncbi:MAG TPA: hypothetical protein VF868_06445 [Bacteroidia bacterium]|jgi:hypothetical protein